MVSRADGSTGRTPVTLVLSKAKFLGIKERMYLVLPPDLYRQAGNKLTFTWVAD
jgi:hypothetical protein